MARKFADEATGSGGERRREAGVVHPVAVRRMRSGDIDRVLQIEHVAFTMPWSSITYRNLLLREDAELWVAESSVDGVVGYMGFWSVLDEGELGTIAVAPRWRGRGVAQRLLQQAFERGLARGLKALFLEVRVSNQVARRLYTAHGFEQVGVRRNYYAFPLEDALVLRRRLDG